MITSIRKYLNTLFTLWAVDYGGYQAAAAVGMLTIAGAGFVDARIAADRFGQVLAATIFSIALLWLGLVLEFRSRWRNRQIQQIGSFATTVRDYVVNNIEPLIPADSGLPSEQRQVPPEEPQDVTWNQADRPLSKRERDNLLVTIALLCEESKIDYLKPAKSAAIIKDRADQNGLSIGETTIEEQLKKIPGALEAKRR